MNLEIGNQKVMSKEYLTPMKFIIDKDYPPKHQLTSEGKFFLQKLAGCKLMIDNPLEIKNRIHIWVRISTGAIIP